MHYTFCEKWAAAWQNQQNDRRIKRRGERGGSVVECRTPEREVRGSRPTAAVLCPWARHFTPRKYWLITQEAMAPSRYDWKIVDWDVKPQHTSIKRRKTSLGVSRLIRVFVVHKKTLGSFATHWAHNEDSDQTGRMPSFAVCTRYGWFSRAAAQVFVSSLKV